jgi:hypothetical protein
MHIVKLEIPATRRTPRVLLEPGRIFIMGRSIPVHPAEFYSRILEWLTTYSRHYKGKTRIDLGFEFINTSSTKYIFLFLKELARMPGMKENSRVNWYYENGDEDLGELGFILRALVECPFVVIEVSEMKQPRYELILAEDSQ